MILCLDKNIQNKASIILNTSSKVIDFERATKIPYEIITKRLNIRDANEQKYNNWYSINHESYYFKNRTYLQNIITELLGVYLSKYMGFDSIEYELAVLNGQLIGLLSKNFRKPNIKYIYANQLSEKDRKKIAFYLTAKENILNRLYKQELYNYIMRLYYAASFDLSINVLCQKGMFLPQLSTLFDYEKSFMDSTEDSIYDPFINLTISGKKIRILLENNPSMEQSINQIMIFNINEALSFIENFYNITIPDSVKKQYQVYDQERKSFIEQKIYKRSN